MPMNHLLMCQDSGERSRALGPSCLTLKAVSKANFVLFCSLLWASLTNNVDCSWYGSTMFASTLILVNICSGWLKTKQIWFVEIYVARGLANFPYILYIHQKLWTKLRCQVRDPGPLGRLGTTWPVGRLGSKYHFKLKINAKFPISKCVCVFFF